MRMRFYFLFTFVIFLVHRLSLGKVVVTLCIQSDKYGRWLSVLPARLEHLSVAVSN